MLPLVSIIIPTYNRSHLIGETLDSVITQTYQNWECIIVDDGSTDYTLELMEFYCNKDARFQYHHRPKDRPKGANACRNYGFELSKGHFIQWLDSDDLLIINGLEKKVQYLINDQYNLSICNSREFNADNFFSLYKLEKSFSDSSLLILYLSGRLKLNTPSLLWKRCVVNDFRFNENLYRAQELDFFFRILQKIEIKPKFLDEILVLIRSHEDSITGAYKRGDKKSIVSELKVRRKTMNYVFSKATTKEDKLRSLNIYLRGIRKLYKNYSIFSVLGELKKMELLLPLKKSYFKWKSFLITSLIFYKITGRELKVKKLLFQAKNHIKF